MGSAAAGGNDDIRCLPPLFYARYRTVNGDFCFSLARSLHNGGRGMPCHSRDKVTGFCLAVGIHGNG
jgi:hypothetical protein